MYVYNDDGSVNVEATYKRSQYDNGSAAGSPPDFQPDSPYGVKPAPYVEPARALPRLGTMPILVAGPGITPSAPKTDEGALGVPQATKLAPSPLAPPGTAILRASPAPESPASVATRVDWRIVVGGTLALFALWWLVAGRDE